MTTKTIEPLTTRNKIRVHSTTCPADMGYDGQPSDWLDRDAGETMGMRQAYGFASELQNKIGQGTYCLVRYYHGDKKIEWYEIENALFESDCDGGN